MNSVIRFVAGVTLFLVVTACQASPELTKSCAALLRDSGATTTNTDLKISVPQDVNDFRLADDVNLAVDNYGKLPIEIAPDRDVRAFVWQEDKWVETSVLRNSLSRVDRLGIKTDMDPGGQLYGVTLNSLISRRPIPVCILATGIQDPDGQPRNIGASVEFVLRP